MDSDLIKLAIQSGALGLLGLAIFMFLKHLRAMETDRRAEQKERREAEKTFADERRQYMDSLQAAHVQDIDELNHRHTISTAQTHERQEMKMDQLVTELRGERTQFIDTNKAAAQASVKVAETLVQVQVTMAELKVSVDRSNANGR